MQEILDEIAEIIYIADVNTYEMLYLNNTARSLFNVDDIKGRKCYEVLQGRDKPCEFCTNSLINKDSFYTWKIFNPISKRHYTLRDKLVRYNKHDARIEIALDITEDVEQRIQLENMFAVENVTLNCVKEIFDNKDNSQSINEALKLVGQFLDAERAYIFEMNDDNTISNTYEWCKEGIVPSKELLQNVDNDMIDLVWKSSIQEGRAIVLNDLETLKADYPDTYNILKIQNINSLIIASLYQEGTVVGYFGVDNPSRKIDAELLLNTVAYFLTSRLQQIAYSNKLEELSFSDGLTGLANRNKYMQDTANLKEVVVKTGIAFVDVNGLKEINDRDGHGRGDEILVKVSEEIKREFPTSSIYRIGGDEFVIICREVDRINFLNRIKSLRRAFALVSPFTAAIGWEWAKDTMPISELIGKADDQMYRDKKSFYRANPMYMRYRKEMDDTLGLADENRLMREIRNDSFFIQLQPKISIFGGKTIGAEALVRYRRKDGEIIYPGQFIPTLEAVKTIKYLDYFVFEKVCELIMNWLKDGKTILPVALNFSRYTLFDKDFLTNIEKIWDKYQVPKKYIDLEITESVESIDPEYFVIIINNLKSHGYSISIDDFGVKYSNLSLLTSVDFNTLKLDGSLVNDITSNDKKCTFVKYILSYCREKGIFTVAEGVETKEQFDLLSSIQCDSIQGFYFSPAVNIDDYVDKWLNRGK